MKTTEKVKKMFWGVLILVSLTGCEMSMLKQYPSCQLYVGQSEEEFRQCACSAMEMGYQTVNANGTFRSYVCAVKRKDWLNDVYYKVSMRNGFVTEIEGPYHLY